MALKGKVPTHEHPRDNGGGEATKPESVGPGIPGLADLADKVKAATQFMRHPEKQPDTAQVAFIPPVPYLDEPGLSADSFSDLSDERWRIYDFGDFQVRLENPMKLNVSKSGGHRVFTADGISHYIPSGWKHLWWKVKDHCPHFTF